MLDEGVEAAEGHGEGGEVGVLDDSLCSVEAALHDEGEGAAVAGHLGLCALVVGAGLEAGVGDRGDLGVLLEELSDLLCVGAVALHTHGEGAEAAGDEEGVEGPHAAAGVLAPLADDVAGLLVLAGDNPADDVAVPVEVLGDRVEGNVRAEDNGVLEDGAGKGVVDNKDGAGLVGNLGGLAEVGDGRQGVPGRFDVHNLGLPGDDGLTEGLRVGSVDHRRRHPKALHHVAVEVHGGAVHHLRAHNVVPGAHEGHDGPGHSAHPAPKGDRAPRVLELSNNHLELLDSGVPDAAVHVALRLLGEEVGPLLGVVEHKRRGLEDGEGVGVEDVDLVSAGDGLLAGVDTHGVEVGSRHFFLFMK